MAFSFVRSDSVEAAQLARHMRHSVMFNLLLNGIAALYKLRKLGKLSALCITITWASRASGARRCHIAHPIWDASSI